MSDVRYYTVTQEREVKVSAETAIDAARIGDAAFNGYLDNPYKDIEGTATTPVRSRDLIVREDY